MRANITPLGGGDPEPWLLEQLAHSRGADNGLRLGREQGLEEGYRQGYKDGYAEGNTAGFNEAIDEANSAIATLNEQHSTVTENAAISYKLLAEEHAKLQSVALSQAQLIQELKSTIVKLEQQIRTHQSNFEAQRTQIHRITTENERSKLDNQALHEQLETLRANQGRLTADNEAADEKSQDKHQQYLEQKSRFCCAVTLLNALRPTIEFVLKQNNENSSKIKQLFATEYKQAVEFKISVDEITSAPHEDEDFSLLLPQTHQFIVDMLNLKSGTDKSAPQ